MTARVKSGEGVIVRSSRSARSISGLPPSTLWRPGSRGSSGRKLLEQAGGSDRSVVDLMRQEEEQQMRRRVEGLRLGGLITTAVGAGMMIFLRVLVGDEPVYVVGLIPLLIGLVLVVYGFFMAPRSPETHS
jgi:hypothetical protein